MATTWKVTLVDYKGQSQTFGGFASRMEAENFAQEQINGNTPWQSYDSSSILPED